MEERLMTGREIRFIFIVFFVIQITALIVHIGTLKRVDKIHEMVDLYFNAPATGDEDDAKG
jgi:hypothetical protein